METCRRCLRADTAAAPAVNLSQGSAPEPAGRHRDERDISQSDSHEAKRRRLAPPLLAEWNWGLDGQNKLADTKQLELARTLFDWSQSDIATIYHTLGISRATPLPLAQIKSHLDH
jgi:hypothetical protein